LSKKELNELIREIEATIRSAKKITRMVYQLAFIALNGGVESDKAFELLHKMVEYNLIPRWYMEKVMKDVERWMKYRYRRFLEREEE